MYDIFYVSNAMGNDADWNNIKSNYPFAQRLSNIKTYEQIRSKSFTKMFWVIWDDVDLFTTFNLLEYTADEWDDMYVHVFKNGKHHDGICLFPKNESVSNREFANRFFSNKKEIDTIASTPKQYNVYYIDTYDEYLKIEDSMFWVVWPGIAVVDITVFDLYFNHYDSYDRNENHVFKHLCNGEESYLNGVVLFSKHKTISKNEFDRKYPIDKKEHDRVASKFQYSRHVISTYDQYLTIVKTETQPMFWCQWPDITITDPAVFDLYFDPNNGKYDHDRTTNHVFKHLCNGEESYLNGVVLFSKEKIISKNEFDRKYPIDKKEHDRVASKFQYPIHIISSYDQYLTIVETATQPMFWCQWPNITITDSTVFDLYFDPNNGKYDHDRTINHVFSHLFNSVNTFANGLVLCSKSKLIGQREFAHGNVLDCKQHFDLASTHTLYDVVFISYDEVNADANYDILLSKCPRAKRIHKVKGIHQAHIAAAELCTTDMIWIVDGDAVIEDNFSFDLVISSYDTDCVHVWRSRNPVNNLEYGNGGVKLLPRRLTLDMDTSSADMTTSISNKFKAIQTVSNTNAFNTDQFAAWRSAFRECCKLAAGTIVGQKQDETDLRLTTWCTIGQDMPFGKYSIMGAIAGKAYGTVNQHNTDNLRKINDFEWLAQQFSNDHTYFKNKITN